ncbi:MAG TPA: toll/interleukin-1 receptor domain-containing protein [Chloroflexia bacterium]|nr:toll/interleukin-1 receptor domain-containing protein [Chloroflexia bacterium]
MANPEHLAIIRQGVEVWNEWREHNPDKTPDLKKANLNWANLDNANLIGANLSDAKLLRADLSLVDLSDANLTRANLMGADLGGADLSDANLTRANLNGANLIRGQLGAAQLGAAQLVRANLTYADLSDTNLSGANLTYANLNVVNLSRARLEGTIFSQARMGSITFGSVDLSTTIGLDTVEYVRPSIIGIDTLYLSKGNIPEVFLRGAGVPEDFISYIPSLVNRPIEFYSCFISYSHVDKSFARRLYDALQGRGIRCWLDEHQMLPGDDIYEQVDRGIRLWDKVLLCCSKDSFTSWWVDDEIERAFKKERELMKERGRKVRTLIPLNLDGYMFKEDWTDAKATTIKSRLAADFRGWKRNNAKFEQQFELVVKALRTGDGGREEPPKPQL